MTLGAELRSLSVDCRAGFFLHIPFPPLDLFLKLPWRLTILKSLLQYDLIGLQTLRDRRNFLQCVREIVPNASVKGRGRVVEVELGDRRLRVGTYPISIDFKGFVERASSETVARSSRKIRKNLEVDQLVLGVDRLDYTKGIPYRLAAFEYALEHYPELRGKISLVQVVAPSRTRVPKYKELKTEIERQVGEINGKFTSSGWVPIHYIYRNLSSDELAAYYRAADMALVTPLKDGMNLIAKEYCAVQLENLGSLILSEFAGAASQFQKEAFLVNPYHIEQVAETIRNTYHCSDDQRRSRMRKLRRRIRKQDVFWWVDSILKSGDPKGSGYLPTMDEYMPHLSL